MRLRATKQGVASRGGLGIGPSTALATTIKFTTASGSWGAHYWIGSQTLTADTHYVEYTLTSLTSGHGCGVSQDNTGPETNSWVFWMNSGSVYILKAGGVVTNLGALSVNLFDRVRFTKSGTSVVVSLNGSTIYTITSAGGTLYPYAASYNGTGYVDAQSVNGAAVTTLTSAACTAVDGVPSTEIFANDSAFYFSKFNWLTDSQVKKKETAAPDAYFKFKFTGSRCAILIDATQHATGSGGTYISWRIDGGAWQSPYYPTDGGKTSVQIANGLTTGTHSAEVAIKTSNYGARWSASARNSSIFFWGVRVPVGATVSAPTTQSTNVLFFTDSNGEGADVDGATSADANAQKAYPRLLAALLGVEHSLVAFPGQGYNITAGANVPVLKLSWNLQNDNSTRLTGGALTPEPAKIFIAEGQNDSSDPTTSVSTMLDAVLAATTSTIIYVCVPCGLHYRSQLTAAVAAKASARVKLVDNSTNWLTSNGANGGTTHLNATGQSLYANALYAAYQLL